MSVHPSIHASICLSMGGGGVPQPGPARGGGTPARSSLGVPRFRYPLLDLAGGVPQPGCPPRVPPSARSGQGVPQPGGCLPGPGYTPPGQDRGYKSHISARGVPTQGTPQYRTAHGVLDKRRSVCLMRSRRRTV